MKSRYILPVIAFFPILLSAQSLSQVAGQINQSVNDATQTARTVNQYKKEVTGQKQREKEAYYQEIQDRENMKLKLTELNGDYIQLDHRLELVENMNKQIDTENSRLYQRIYALEQETQRLKAENETYKRSFSDLVERLNRLELSEPKAAKETTETTSSSSSEFIHLNSSSAPTQAHTSQTHRTYTPKASQYYIRGPRGGCYYLTASGRKQYVDRSLCN